MVVEGTLTHPCPGFAVGKPAMVVVRVQGAPPWTFLVSQVLLLSHVPTFLLSLTSPSKAMTNTWKSW
jgi:hypothetical protein